MTTVSPSSRLLLTVVATMITLGSTAPGADASPVNIRFGFTSFSSVVEPPASVPLHTFVSTSSGAREIFPASDTPFTVTFPSTDSIEFYHDSATRNRVWFTPGPEADVRVGEKFKLGTFFFVNGTWFGDADMAFDMFTVSTDPALSGHHFINTIRMALNVFDPDPIRSADRFHLLDPTINCSAPSLPIPATCQSARVYELFDSPILPRVDGISNAGSIELWGMVGSLIPTEFRNPQGGLLLSGSITEDPNPILDRPGAAVSEPATLLLLGAGLVGFATGIRRRKRTFRHEG